MCTDEDYKIKQKNLWSLFMDGIDMSPSFAPLLGYRLVSQLLESNA